MNSLADVEEAVFLLSGVRTAARSIARGLPAGARPAAEAQNADLEAAAPRFLDPGQDDDFLFVQLRGATLQWAMLAHGRARQV